MTSVIGAALAAMPGASGHAASVALAIGPTALADGLRLALQHDGPPNDFTIVAVAGTDPAAWVALAPDILILDPAGSSFRPEVLADLLGILLPETALIGSCSGTDALAARALVQWGFRAAIPKAPDSDALALIVLSVACGGICLHEVFCAPTDPA